MLSNMSMLRRKGHFEEFDKSIRQVHASVNSVKRIELRKARMKTMVRPPLGFAGPAGEAAAMNPCLLEADLDHFRAGKLSRLLHPEVLGKHRQYSSSPRCSCWSLSGRSHRGEHRNLYILLQIDRG